MSARNPVCQRGLQIYKRDTKHEHDLIVLGIDDFSVEEVDMIISALRHINLQNKLNRSALQNELEFKERYVI